jgi:hypothetical protein
LSSGFATRSSRIDPLQAIGEVRWHVTVIRATPSAPTRTVAGPRIILGANTFTGAFFAAGGMGGVTGFCAVAD